MENNITILGNESSVIFYNLNKQFSNLKKIIITKEIILGSFEDSKIRELFSKLSLSNSKEYTEILDEWKKSGIFNAPLKNEFHKQVQESLKNLSNTAMDVKLKDYNFMSSVSNARYTVTLRCENFSLSHFYIEKGAIHSSIKHLVEEYLSFKGNWHRLARLENFQIEISETEEAYKQVFLKKEGNSLVLYASFGFPKGVPFDYTIGGEYYFSIGEDFKFYENQQTHAIIRDHSKLALKEIYHQEKILSNEDLVNINNITKNINDAIIEMYINKKGALRISNLSLLENSIYTNSENGIIINKSSKNYNKISLIGLRDNYKEELPNPKYLIVRNMQEIDEIFENVDMLEYIDGIIFTTNFYSPLIDKMAQVLDIDIIYSKNPLQKSLEVGADFEKITFEGANFKSGSNMSNPFSNILETNNKDKDEFLEKLKNIDLSTPNESSGNDDSHIENIAQSIISSPNASSANYNNNSKMNWPNSNSNSKGKLSAISMIAENVLKNNSQPIKENPTQNQEPHGGNNNFPESYGQQHTTTQPSLNRTETQDLSQQHYSNQQHHHKLPETHSKNPFDDFFGEGGNMEKAMSGETIQKNTPHNTNLNSELIMEGVKSRDINPLNENQINSFEKEISNKMTTESIVNKYEKVLAVKVLSSPNIKSDYYFADSNTIHEIHEGKIYFMAANAQSMSNPNIEYIIPVNMYQPGMKKCYLLINSISEFFMIDEKNCEMKFFANISNIESQIKKNFIRELLRRTKRVSLIISKNDITYLEDYISKIDEIFAKDIHSKEELDEFKNKILSFEKKYLMRN